MKDDGKWWFAADCERVRANRKLGPAVTVTSELPTIRPKRGGAGAVIELAVTE